MREYRFYLIGKDGHISGAASTFSFETDGIAIKQANLVAEDLDIEVWQGPRLVAYVVPNQNAS
ncbi:MAG: hypothetical protein Q7T81_01635 [Pseudolabrys sp.]|nr:hypothetical protein [Pseudolabrys sp.]